MQVRPSTARVWWAAARPKTLTAAIVPVLVGTALARNEVALVRWDLFFYALLGAVLIQIGTNFVNDAADFKKGTDTAERIGPLRVTSVGWLSADTVMRAAFVCFALAALVGVPLIQSAGAPLLWVGVASIVAAYAYTAGPFPLAYLGLGEIFVMIFFGWVAVGGTYYLHAGQLSTGVWIAGTCLGCLSTALLAVNNLRDRGGDSKTHKNTLAVRFGERFARVEVQALAFLPFALLLYWVKWRLWFVVLLPLLALPLALKLSRLARTGEGAILNQGLAKAAALHAVFGALLALALWMSVTV